MWILDCKPKKIKNPISSRPNYRYGFSELYDAQAKAFEDGVKAVLAHVREIDIDEKVRCWVDGYSNTHTLDEIDMRISFSQFLIRKAKELNMGKMDIFRGKYICDCGREFNLFVKRKSAFGRTMSRWRTNMANIYRHTDACKILSEKLEEKKPTCERTFSPDADDCVNCKERPCHDSVHDTQGEK